MKTEKIVVRGGEGLLLFFAGWGMDAHPFRCLGSNTLDVICVSDYTELTFDRSVLAGYKEIHLLAWSMGVWAAARTVFDIPFVSATAINGTEQPIDDAHGIPVAVFNGTLESLSEEGLNRFNRRMCGSKETLNQFKSAPVNRTVDALRDELRAIGMAVQSACEQPSLPWTKALLSTADRIFPAENLVCFWQDRCPICLLDASHYPFQQWSYWDEIIH